MLQALRWLSIYSIETAFAREYLYISVCAIYVRVHDEWSRRWNIKNLSNSNDCHSQIYCLYYLIFHFYMANYGAVFVVDNVGMHHGLFWCMFSVPSFFSIKWIFFAFLDLVNPAEHIVIILMLPTRFAFLMWIYILWITISLSLNQCGI